MSLKVSEPPRLIFVVNPIINAYYHVERSSGSVFEHFSSEYRRKTIDLLDDSAVRDFMRLLGSPQRISWLFKKAASQSSNTSEFNEISRELVNEWQANIIHVVDVSAKKYLTYFEKEVKPKLEKYKDRLGKTEPKLRKRLSRISIISKKPWKLKQYTVFLVESLSSKYGMGGEPVFDEAISIGIMPVDMAIKFVIPHELTHVLLGDTIRKIIGEANLLTYLLLLTLLTISTMKAI